MSGTVHKDFSANELHAPGYITSTDPVSTYGTDFDALPDPGVGSGQLWIEESSGDTPKAVKYRNAANDGWVTLHASVIPSLTQGDLLYADATPALATLGIGSEHDVLVTGGSTAPAWKSGLTNDNIAAAAEIAVSKLADGTARQLLQTDAAGTGVEWTSNVDIPGTLDVTGAVTLDSTLTIESIMELGSRDATGSAYVSNPDAGEPFILGLHAADGDGTDFVSLDMFAVGTKDDISNRERFRMSYSSSNTRFEISEDVAGTGVLRDIAIVMAGTDALVVDTSANVSTTGAATLDTGANGSSFGGDLTVGGNLNINPSNTYTITNDATDRTFDANSTSTAELADVLATLLKDLGMDA